MSFYSQIKAVANAVNSERLSEPAEADLFRDGLYVGKFDIPGSPESLPVIVPIELFGSLCVIDDGSHRQQVVDFLQACAFRILSSVDSASCNFILYDGVSLGRGLISLSELDNRIKGDKILTTPAELSRALEKLSDRVVTVIQNILGSKYANSSLIEYNKTAGKATEPYYFLFLKDYPAGLNNEQCRLIEQIVQSGPQAGIFSFISYSTEHYSDTSYNSNAKNILKHTANIVHYKDDTFLWHNIPNQEKYNYFPFRLATVLPNANLLKSVFEKVTEQLNRAENIKVDIMSELKKSDLWKSDASSGIEVPIGRQNVSTLQNFRLAGEINHVLIGGSTGYGKSVLLHNIICNIAWRYSPEQVQMILLDYKEGTEFKVYEELPHARVLSIQSDREYGCSVFRFIEEEIHRRGELFRTAGVQDITSYNRFSGTTMPRLLIIIDEFQKLLDGDMKTTAFISSSMEDVGRRGRSFGINLILSTQSLINVNLSGIQQSLGLRIVLHLNTQFDCDRFLSNNNNVPYTTLTRPGQAVYNSRAGLSEGNVLFQTAFMSREDLNTITGIIRDRARQQYNGDYAPYTRFFYDGSSRAEFKNNKELSKFTKPNDRFMTIFVGEPVALKENHVSFKMRRQNGSNVLIVGADEDSAYSLISFSTIQILNQSEPDTRILIADKTNSDSPYFEKLEEEFASYPDRVCVSSWDETIKEFIEVVHSEMTERRKNCRSGYRIVLIFNNIYDIRFLRKAGYTRLEHAQKLIDIIKDGPSVGIHTCVYASTYTNLTQIFDAHEILPEFDVKIELCGGNGFRIFGGSGTADRSQLHDNARYMANMKIGDNEGLVKFKVYTNKSE